MDLNSSVAILHDKASRLSDKVLALRSLQALLLDSGSGVPSIKKRQIKQLIMDSILYVIMNEDVSSDLHRRQLVKTECVLMMANMIDSTMLYDIDTDDLHADADSSIDSIEVMSRSLTSDSSPERSPTAKKLLSLKTKFESSSSSIAKKMEHSSSLLLPPVSPDMSTSMSASASPMSPDHKSQQHRSFSLKTRALISPAKIAHSNILHVEQLSDTSVKGFLLRTQKKRLKQMKQSTSRKTLYFKDDDDKCSPGRSLVPGVRASDFTKQERILGYRTPKTWFPFQVVGVNGSLSPDKRSKSSFKLSTKPDDIVEEYLKLKALISYFGDIVKAVPSQSPTSSAGEGFVKASVDNTRFKSVLKDMVHLWTPLLGLSLSQDSKSKFTSRLYRKSANQAVDESAFEQHDLVSYESSTILPIDQIWDLFLSKEKKKKKKKNDSGSHPSSESKDNNKNPRHILLNVMNKLYEHKMKNLLALAMGIWKIHLVIKESRGRTKHYARRVGMSLVYQIFQKAIRKKFLRSVNVWKRAVSTGIFLERSHFVVLIQTLFRKSRARAMIARVTEEAPYNGPLSDIYLAPQRAVAFTIPRAVRQTRRLYWMSIVAIQTYYRMYQEYQEYLRLRARVILLQSVCRMCPRCMYYRRLRAHAIKVQAQSRCASMRRKFLYLKAKTIFAQCCIRRFLSWKRKMERFGAVWCNWELRSSRAVAIQCRWRMYKAKSAVRRRVLFDERRLWGALFMARKWYKLRGNFSTFVLMSAYRAREVEDQLLRDTMNAITKKNAARQIQRFYKVRFAELVTKFVVKVQCWYRFHHALNYMPMRRERRRCARKIRCWIRLVMRRRGFMARRIQNVWWNFKAKRGVHLRRRHLQRKCIRRDESAERMLRYRSDLAAARIQGVCKGVLCRRAIFISFMATRIQRLVRWFVARRRRERERIARKKKVAVTYVKRIVTGCVNRRVVDVMRRQAEVIVRLQACARAFVVRKVVAKFVRASRRYALCVLLIQRLWRARKLYMECVAQVESERRSIANPFKGISGMPALFAALYAQTAKCISYRDPRLGLTMYGFLHRLGRLDLADMFPRQKYKLFLDLRGVSIKKLKDMYSEWEKRVRYSGNTGGGSSSSKEKVSPSKPKRGKESDERLYPMPFFAVLLALLAADPRTKRPEELELLKLITPLQEWAQPPFISQYVYSKFFAKFGAAHQAKATNLANAVVIHAWYNYNNYKSVLDIITIAQVDRAIEATGEASRVRDALRDMLQRESSKPYVQDMAWDKDRVGKSLAAHQYFLDQLRGLFDPRRSVGRYLCREMDALNFFSRQYKYNHDNDKVSYLNPKDVISDADKLDSLVVVSFDTALELEYAGPRDLDGFDHKVTVLKFMTKVVGHIEKLNRAVISLKSVWMRTAMKKRLKQHKFQLQAAQLNEKYLHDRHANHVHEVWEVFRKSQLAQQRFKEMRQIAADRRRHIEAGLRGVARHGWVLISGAEGDVYYDRSQREEPQCDVPLYTFEQYLAVLSIQSRARKFLQHLHQRKYYKEMLAQEEVRRAQAIFDRQLEDAYNLVHISLALREKPLPGASSTAAEAEAASESIEEEQLPRKYRLFRSATDYASGTWGLLQSSTDEHVYESVLVFNIRAGEGGGGGHVCDVKSFSGARRDGVDMSRVFDNAFCKGSRVEARYSRQVHFYRGTVTGIRHSRQTGGFVYDISYDDGEAEEGVSRDLMRFEAGELEHVITTRRSLLKAARAAVRRRAFFASLRSSRLERNKLSIGRCEYDFVAGWKAARDASAKKPGTAYIGMLQSAAGVAKSSTAEISTHFEYTRVPLRFGWSSRRFSNNRALYAHRETNTLTFSVPTYTSEEARGAQKLQSVWFIKKARTFIMNFIYTSPLDVIVRGAVAAYKRHAFVGYGDEGVTTMQLLRRAGYDDVATVLEKYDQIHHSKQSTLQTLTLKFLSRIHKDHFGRYGLTQFDIVRRFIDFQAWYNKTPLDKQRAALSFLNHFEGAADPRSMKQCIGDSEELIYARFTKVHPTGASRNRNACKAVARSGFPVTHAMLAVYLDKYKDNAEMARESVDELVDVPTTHTYVDERRALDVLLNASQRIRVTLNYFSLKIISDRVEAVLAKVLALVAEGSRTNSPDDERDPYPGCEGKGALILRCEVLDYVMVCSRAAVVLQREARRFVLSTRYRKDRHSRHAAARRIQRAALNRRSREIYRLLLRQRDADWEQLWDDKHQSLYYYNCSSKESRYTEPHEVFRPLVRDRLSSRLVQAWPTYKRAGVEVVVEAAATAVCSVCRSRRSTNVSYDRRTSRESPLCFSCYSKLPVGEKSDGAAAAASRPPPLSCSNCAGPATRKCLGPLGERAVEDICSRLRKAPVGDWLKLLKEYEVVGTQKISLFLDSILLTSGGDVRALDADLTTDSRMDHVRAFLERINVECDETYCSDCYTDTHSRGRRQRHRWIGFQIGAAPCDICSSSPAVLICDECADCRNYCQRCYPMFHSKGKRLKHHSRPLVEELEGDDPLCMQCSRRRAVDRCENDGCDFLGCDSCYACVHVERCAAERAAAAARRSPKKSLQDLEVMASDRHFCTNCGEQADSSCAQCKDFYCSRTWMGWDGCFLANHQKGFRKTHKCVEI